MVWQLIPIMKPDRIDQLLEIFDGDFRFCVAGGQLRLAVPISGSQVLRGVVGELRDSFAESLD